MTDAETAIRRRQAWIDAVEAGDAEAYAALVSDDVVWIPPSGDPLHGRAAFRAWLEPFVGAFGYEMHLETSATHEAGDWAWETGSFRSVMTPLDGGTPQEHRGRYFVLWHRDSDGVWRIDRYVDGVGADAGA